VGLERLNVASGGASIRSPRFHDWPVSGRTWVPVMTGEKMLNQGVYSSLRFFLKFGGCKLTISVSSPRP
jgi:hypothetical protein